MTTRSSVSHSLVTGKSHFVDREEAEKNQRKDQRQRYEESTFASHFFYFLSELLASGDKEGCLKVWQIRTGKCVKRFDQAHSKAVTCVTFTRDAQKVLTGSFDGTVR